MKARTAEERQQAVATTIELCIQNSYLTDYLERHRSEVEKIMMSMLTPEYIKMAAERSEKIKGDISV